MPMAHGESGGGALLEISDLRAGIEDKQILKGIDLSIDSGEIHAIMGDQKTAPV